MTENQPELFAVMSIVGIAIPVIGFLIGIIVTMRSRAKEKNIIKKLYEKKERSNGKSGARGHY